MAAATSDQPLPANCTTNCLCAWERGRLLAPSLVLAAALLLIPFAHYTFKPAHGLLQQLPLNSFFSTAVQFASGTIATGIILLIWLLDPPRRALTTYFLVALLVAGNVNMVIKVIAGRARPTWAVALSRSNQRELTEGHVSMADQLAMKRDRWMWLGRDHHWLDDRYNSFPSGHAVSAFCAAAFLCLLYPRARVVWLIAAISCAIARVRFQRHYPEDVMMGGAIGWMISLWVFSWCWPLRLGRWVEMRLDAMRANRTTPR
jgi:membrane-associated phospholipid phosphatase